jgi:quinol monooxygenase YgiN
MGISPLAVMVMRKVKLVLCLIPGMLPAQTTLVLSDLVIPLHQCNNAGSERRFHMVKLALLVRLEAKPGKESDVENFLRGGLPLVQDEPATIAWFGIRLGPSSFGIFDAFPDEAGRQAHLSGKVAAALMAKAPELLARPPVIEKVEILAAKLPE